MSDPHQLPVTYDVTDSIGTVTFNRPREMNSLTLSAKEALRDALHDAAADSEVRCVVLTGRGAAFCVGQDLREHATVLAGDAPSPLVDTVAEHYNPIAMSIATMPKPVIAAVNGIAAGAGASIAFAADFRLMSASAGFNLAFAAIGFSCDTGSSWTLPRLVGHGRATELLMLPRTIGAEEAHALGLATKVVADDDLTDEVGRLARSLADGPTLAYASIKRALAFSASHDLASSLEHEGQKMALTARSSDHRDAVAAFLAKERPVFTGR